MPAKKTRKAADGARYLLSADRKFRRLSLKKISERVKNARTRTRTRARSSAKAVTPSEPLVRDEHNSEPRNAPVALVLGGAVLFAAVVGVLWSSPSPLSATENAAVPSGDVASAPAVPMKPVAVSPAAPPPALKVSPAPAAIPSTTSRAPEAVKTRAEATPALSPVSASSESAASHQELAATSVDTVTISGCLDYDGKSAWLKDTSGIDAPRSRSWRSGFLKKRATRIALVDGPASASAWDGRRVSVTGVLADRAVRVNSMKPIEGNCE